MIGRSIPLSVLTICLTASICRAGEPGGGRHCRPVGGTVTTNFVSDTTTLGTVTGDLRGAVSATLLGQAPGANDTIVFTVQHHWVTDDGDTILLKVATATAKPVAPGLLAIVSYPARISGGTGKFAGAYGMIENIGELDANRGATVFRYHGTVCFADSPK